jgi:hypothetical protein
MHPQSSVAHADDCLSAIRNAVRMLRPTAAPDAYRIRGIWGVSCLFQPNAEERIFQYRFVVAQTLHQGCAYGFDTSNADDQSLRALIGCDYFEVSIPDPALDIALLDAIYAPHRGAPAAAFHLSGSPITKAKDRAYIVASEMMRSLPPTIGRRPRIVNIGAVGNIISELQARGCDVSVTDLDPALVGSQLCGIEVQNASLNSTLVAESDGAVITAMTLFTHTMDDILIAAHTKRIPVVVFAQSGSSFARFFIERGAQSVVAELFPFYIFQGASTLLVYRRTEDVR